MQKNTPSDFLAHGDATLRCDKCCAYAQHQKTVIRNDATSLQVGITVILCKKCSHPTIVSEREIEGGRIIYPHIMIGPEPASGMAPPAAKLFVEARAIGQLSPRAAVALLRVALEKMLPGQGKLYDRITALASDVNVQRIMELVRILGNEAVHGDDIDFDAAPDVAVELMGLMNVLVDILLQGRPMRQLRESLPTRVSDRARFFGDPHS